MKIQLTNNSNTDFALSNDFNEVPIMMALLEDCDTIDRMLEIVNTYSVARKWSKKLVTTKRAIFESKDRIGNLHYVIIRSE